MIIDGSFNLSHQDIEVMTNAYESYLFDLQFDEHKDDPGWRKLDWHTYGEMPHYSAKRLLVVGVFEWEHVDETDTSFFRITRDGISILTQIKPKLKPKANDKEEM